MKCGVKKGNIPWNKGVTGYSTTKNGKVGICDNTGRTHFKVGYTPANKGKHFVMSEEWKQNISKATKGKEHKKSGYKHTQEWKDERSKWMKKQSAEFYANCLRRRPMSSLEKKYDEMFTKNNLPYKFVGNGDFWIGKKNPDFVNTNGKKIAIEVYYRKHKDMFRGGAEKWKKGRIECFKKYGWEIIFLEPSDLITCLNLLKGGEII